MKQYKFTILYTAIMILPAILYLITNFYCWLFDGNILNEDKMEGAVVWLLLTGWVIVAIALTENHRTK